MRLVSPRVRDGEYGHVMAVDVAAKIAVVVIVIGLIYASRGRVARYPELWDGALCSGTHDLPRRQHRSGGWNGNPPTPRTKTPNENAADLLGQRETPTTPKEPQATSFTLSCIVIHAGPPPTPGPADAVTGAGWPELTSSLEVEGGIRTLGGLQRPQRFSRCPVQPLRYPPPPPPSSRRARPPPLR